jgi:hypothetical protein
LCLVLGSGACVQRAWSVLGIFLFIVVLLLLGSVLMAFSKLDIKIEALNGENYGTWSLKTKMVCDMNQVGHLLKAPVDGVDIDAAKDAQVFGFLCLHVADYILQSLCEFQHAHEVWAHLRETYAQQSHAARVLLNRKLSALRMNVGEPVDKYIARATAIRAELGRIGKDVDEDTLVSQILAGLPDNFQTVVSVITASEEELTLRSALRQLLAHEATLKGMSGASDGEDATALWSHGRGAPGKGGAKPGGGGGRKPGERDLSKVVCFGCKQKGHYKRDCPKLKGGDKTKQRHGGAAHLASDWGECGALYSELVSDGADDDVALPALCESDSDCGFDSDSDSDSDCGGDLGSVVTFPNGEHALISAADLTGGSCVWVVDSGASHHMTGAQSVFTDLRPFEGVSIKIGDGMRLPVEGIGTVQLVSILNGVLHEIELHEVYYVPGLKVNLLSVGMATNRGVKFDFRSDRCDILSPKGIALIEAPKLADLYACELYQPRMLKAAYTAITNVDSVVWHRRFAHLGYQNLAKAVDMVTGMQVTSKEVLEASKANTVCPPCAMGKQAKLPFPKSAGEHAATEVLGRVHTDVQGPMHVASIGGARYVVGVLDECSDLSEVRLVKTKDQVIDALEEIFNLFVTQTGKMLKIVRSDRGGEYTSAALKRLLHSNGVIHEFTCPYTSEQNGRAEALNKTLSARVRSVRVEAGLPEGYWGELYSTINYLRNLSPVSSKKVTPIEGFYGVKPNVAHLRVIGCLAYVLTPAQFRKKLDPKSQPAVFLGYEPNTKGYRLLLRSGKNSGKIVISRNVVFDETKLGYPLLFPSAKVPVGTEVAAKVLGLEGHGKVPKLTEPEVVEIPLELGDGELPALDNGEDQVEGDVGDHGAQVEPAQLPDGNDDEDGDVATGPRYPKRVRARPARLMDEQSLFASAFELDLGGAAFVAKTMPLDEALQTEDGPEYMVAANQEYQALLDNQTWELVPRSSVPKGQKVLPCKMIVTEKLDADGNRERLKARCVAGGHRQKHGIDYGEVFAPTGKYTTLRVLMALTAARGYVMHAMDIKTAFLNGDLEEEVYMEQPKHFAEDPENYVCKLKKSLYGLKQAPRAWYKKFSSVLKPFGLVQSKADPALFVTDTGTGPLWLWIWVDDTYIFCPELTNVNELKSSIQDHFKATDQGEPTQVLGMKVERDRKAGTIKISQPKLIKSILEEFGMWDAKPMCVPFNVQLRKDGDGDDDELLDPNDFQYPKAVGALIHLLTVSRPDLAFPVGAAARHMASPRKSHKNAVLQILRYLAGTKDVGIVYGRSDSVGAVGAEHLQGWCDADFAGNLDNRRSTTGYAFTLAGGAISWASKLQPTVATSTTEAEYKAAAFAIV